MVNGQRALIKMQKIMQMNTSSLLNSPSLNAKIRERSNDEHSIWCSVETDNFDIGSACCNEIEDQYNQEKFDHSCRLYPNANNSFEVGGYFGNSNCNNPDCYIDADYELW